MVCTLESNRGERFVLPSQLRIQSVARQLFEGLAQSGVLDILSIYRTERIRHETMLVDTAILPPDLSELLSFITRCEAMPLWKVEQLLPDGCLGGLIDCGMAEAVDDEVRLRYRLYFHFGVFIFAQSPSFARKFYYGTDSLALGSLILPVSGRVLDICTGPGAQAMLCAKTSETVWGVDANPDVEALFYFNAAFNGVASRVAFVHSDVMLDRLPYKDLDRVVCNPPLLPVPQGIQFPYVGNGGEDGLTITRRIVEQLGALLAPTGKAQIIGTCLGNDKPFLDDLAETMSNAGLRALFILPCRHDLKSVSNAPMLSSLVKTAVGSGHEEEDAVASYSDMLTRLQATHLYSFYLIASPRAEGVPPVSYAPYYFRSADFWHI